MEPGHFRNRALHSAKVALIRNVILFLIFGASATGWGYQWVTTAKQTEALAAMTFLGLVALFFGWRTKIAAGRASKPTTHPLFDELRIYGEPMLVAERVEQEMQALDVQRFGEVALTFSFLVKESWPRAVIRHDDIAWVYPKSTRHSVNFIPTGTTHSLELFTISSMHRWVALGLESNDALYAALQRVAPQAQFGYSPERERQFQGERLTKARRKRADHVK